MRVLLVLLAVLFGSFSAKADETAIRDVISGQIEAFKVDDFDRAFTYASPTIQSIFRNSETFGRMVQNGYPMVWRPANVEYLDVTQSDGQFVQKVLITAQNGALHVLAYDMIDTPDGWQIDAVRLIEAPQVGA